MLPGVSSLPAPSVETSLLSDTELALGLKPPVLAIAGVRLDGTLPSTLLPALGRVAWAGIFGG